MLNLSTPEAIQAHKDYAQRTCGRCGVDISSKRSNAKFCTERCRKRAEVRRWTKTPNGRVSINKCRNNSDAHKVYKQTGYMQASKTALRIDSMFERATERQRQRLADWLLRVRTKPCSYWSLDEWISVYNTNPDLH